jgi:hypothetical protein
MTITPPVADEPTRRPTLSEVQAFIDQLDDLALLVALKSRIVARLPVETLVSAKPAKPWGLPPFGDLTIAQVCLFDNGKNPRAKAPYGLALEWWTGPVDEIDLKRPAAKLNVTLHTANGIRRLLKTNRSKDKVWIKEVAAFANETDKGGSRLLYGPVFATAPGKGSGYVKGQMVLLDIENGLNGVAIFMNSVTSEVFKTDCWTDQLHTGDPLKGNAAFVSRVAFTEFRDGWATDNQH